MRSNYFISLLPVFYFTDWLRYVWTWLIDYKKEAMFATHCLAMHHFKNILFDLGGIFLNIDYQKTEQAFVDLGVKNFGQLFSQQFSNTLFESLETGKIAPDEFYEAFRKETNMSLPNKAIEHAWNAMLLDFPKERLDWLQIVAQQYPVYLFSNTNLIHYQSFIKDFVNQFPGEDFNDYFRKAYYSHELGLRKPYPESYLKIMELENLDPSETLFIDDTPKNIEGAKSAGLQTILLNDGRTVLDLEF
jgi:HAD superfamily hydrolase (TIGR01549 family)